MKTVLPTKCKLWLVESLPYDDIQKLRDFELLETLEDKDSDDVLRTLYRCKECGQLYFYEFYEDPYWETGDAQYFSFVPVKDEAQAHELAKTAPFELVSYRPRLQASAKANEKPTDWTWARPN